MLILSRHQGQRVQFPELGINVEVLNTNKDSVLIGVDAPPDVVVLREEVVDGATTTVPAKEKYPLPHEWVHQLRGRINAAVMGLYLAEKRLQAGRTEEAEKFLHNSLKALEKLELVAASVETATPIIPADQKPLEALVVEDDVNEETLLSSYLQMSGVKVKAVHDGEAALNYLSTHQRPDFVLLDMNLPKIDGPTMLFQIRQNPAYSGMRVFAVSGSCQEELCIPNGIRGVDAWFAKPVNPLRIIEAMNQPASH
jgi:carbon storage regulator CsrA